MKQKEPAAFASGWLFFFLMVWKFRRTFVEKKS
jgi:hypothetical protein